MASLVTRIIDNLQVTVRNVHVRIENKDTSEVARNFSLGVTLGAVDLFTTDEDWQRCYVDRSSDKYKDKPVAKWLSITNFALYYKTNEHLFIQNKESDDARAQAMHLLVS